MPIRALIMQPTLPKYRIPVFRDLASRPGIELLICHGLMQGIPLEKADGFSTHVHPYSSIPAPGGGFEWHFPPVGMLSRRRIDVAVLQWNIRFLSLPLTVLRCRLAGIPVVLWGHGCSKQESPAKAALRRWMGSWGDAVIVYNRGTADALVAAGLARDRTFVALNALDPEPIAKACAALRDNPAILAEHAKAIWSIPGQEFNPSSGPRLLHISRLNEANRLDRALHAIAALRGTYPAIKLVVVGNGPDEKPLRALAAQLGIEPHITFAGAIYSDEELAPYFLTAQQFIYPENIGLSLNHAMAHGLPVITSDRTEAQNPEIEALRHEHNGLLYAHGDDAAFRKAIVRLHLGSDFRRTLADAAWNTIHGRYTISRMVDGLEAALRYAVASRKGDMTQFALPANS